MCPLSHLEAAQLRLNTLPMSAMTFAITMLVASMVQLGEPAAKGGLKEKEWKAACALAADFGLIARKATGDLQAAVSVQLNWQKTYLRYQVFVEAYKQGRMSKEDTALLEFYAKQADKAALKLTENAIADKATAIRDASRAEASISEFIYNMAQLSHTNTHSCLEKSSGSNSQRPVTDDLSSEAPGCTLNTARLAASSTAAPFTDRGYDKHFKTAVTNGDQLTAASLACELTGPKASTRLLDGTNGGDTIQGTLKFAAGLYYSGASQLDQRSLQDMTGLASAAPFLHAGHSAHLKTQEQQQAFQQPTTSSIKGNSDFQEIYKKIVLGQKPVKPNDPANIGELIAQSYPETADNLKSDYGGRKVVNLQAEDPVEVPLKDVNSMADLAALLQHYKAINTAATDTEIKQLKNKTTRQEHRITETDETCKAKGTGDECKPPCKVEGTGKDAKCKLDKEKGQKIENQAEKEGGKDGKTDDKCSDKKKEGECTGNCKWDGKECKDSSFLVHKKFALSMVSAFMRLVRFLIYF
ncbi:Trypanosome variant surface glycoprotein (A-type)/Trypanosome variant surface glycoprotein C-terminal domain containing protein, putative [Trypanosoma equiperdum]|uniref:Trypanosome variant surface glycoprotein (A-type)/Trypanosome variant surface glycoprotein C-terminal domain containing protein, putative n=1 Tax=Trypanosoma equiperdum TaxID=5694 RepID=A0A1G4HYM9_TRYEQ|nr:Trypanosome variant surface glycoprotein (A-type)/Trypanosome variant surface glycoprotein C-terminal domain containing protein, putative [Trypanosoma equiperdum]